MDLLIGTSNRGKVREYQTLLDGLPLRLLSLTDVGLGTMDVDETADTYERNAILKARAYAQASGLYALADDSGIEVEALGGRPGLFSARYAGPDADEVARYRKVLAEMADVPDDRRAARFVCVTAVADPHSLNAATASGIVTGRIARGPSGDGGFGYDPIFIPDGYEVTIASLPPEVKDELSHRGRAARAMIPILEGLIGLDHHHS
jgi:XTP/dITP diphosphohydrolase